MITIVVAMGKNNAIGADNQLLWHLPKDLKHFKNLTSEHPIIMGRKTYESIGKPLPNRTNIVVSQKPDWFEEGILIVGSLKEAMKFAKKIDEDFFIIGGGSIYQQTIDLADRLEVTLVDSEPQGDTFFPDINPKIWTKTNEVFHPKDEQNPYDLYFQTYEKQP
ncbi:dihydrofolate reductase [Riemerella columbina]|uniref:dihydrofolate reductase n=1 Tax=Riemerella columbina TaxID=103810 RepID=UPI00266EDF33|nr:dihydrofolate reductase [Riemerella columbina]WKS94924.1 dihydrofolate reductase [Riemerella columbina]